MIRKTILIASLGLLAACAPQHEPQPFIYGGSVYQEPTYGSRRMVRQRRQEDPLNALDKATRSIDSIVRRAQRWDR